MTAAKRRGRAGAGPEGGGGPLRWSWGRPPEREGAHDLVPKGRQPVSLAGRTIASARLLGPRGFDDANVLELGMADGSVFRIRAWYGQWTDRSEGEYPRRLSIAMARRPATGGKRAGHLTIDAFVEPFHVWHCDEAPAGRPPRAGARSRSKGRRG